MTDNLEAQQPKSIAKKLFPHLEREERRTLAEKLQEGAVWNPNFGVMLACSVVIAGLGLLQNSPAVVIGAMLVAPLMTPLIATGLALVQGNVRLLKEATKAMGIGTVLSLFIGILLQWLTPGNELTLELLARTTPNILDLCIAVFSGVAAAYAVSRPELSGALPGVAIAVALVPPLAACGIALGAGEWAAAEGTGILFLTNLVAIVLGSAAVFWLHGLHILRGEGQWSVMMVRIITGLVLAAVILTAPLGYQLAEQLAEGQVRPIAYPVSPALHASIRNRIDREDGVELIMAARAGAVRRLDVGILLSSESKVSPAFISELENIVADYLGEEIKTEVWAVQAAKEKKK